MTRQASRHTSSDASGSPLFRMGSWLRRGKAGDDARQVFLEGGREADVFYRQRYSYDKVVRSTHGVNCTGSCSWKVYVKDGIITWESQQTDYPTTGPDMPEYEPRGCPRGAAFSWYEYSPTRIKHPYVRSALVDLYREARARLGDPVLAWGEIVSDPEKSRAYKTQRGRGGMIRVSWEEATEIIAAAYVHTLKAFGPDRCAGFSVIPAMSMISYGAGSRFHALIGAPLLSFYDWYADLPPASPQVFGDQTDVPESGDWFNSQYLIMWGSNVPLTRTPDAHFMAEARYHGQKVVVVSPDFADNTKFADDWLRVHPGTDGALAQAMGHVILKEFHVGRREPSFLDYMRRYSDSPFLVRLDALGQDDLAGAPGGQAEAGQAAPVFAPGKFLTADLMPEGTTQRTEHNDFRPLVMEADGTVKDPGGTLADHYGQEGMGHWNLALKGVDPVMSVMDTDEWHGALVALPRFDLPAEAGQESVGAGVVLRGVPARRVDGHLVTTVYDLLLAQYAVGRDGLPGQWPTGYDDPSTPGTPAWQEEITGVSAGAAVRIGREFALNALESGGRSMILMGAGTNHYYHSDQIYRTFLALTTMCATQGVNGGGWAHYVGQEKVRPITGWANYAFALDWQRPARQMIATGWYYLTTDQWRYDGARAEAMANPLGPGRLRGKTIADCLVESAQRGWTPSYPTFDRNPLELGRAAREAGVPPAEYVAGELAAGRLRFAAEDPDAEENRPRILANWRTNLLGSPPRAPNTSCVTCWARSTTSTPKSCRRAAARRPWRGGRKPPPASSTSCGRRTSGTHRPPCTPTSCCPPPPGTRNTTCRRRTCTPSCTPSTQPSTRRGRPGPTSRPTGRSPTSSPRWPTGTSTPSSTSWRPRSPTTPPTNTPLPPAAWANGPGGGRAWTCPRSSESNATTGSSGTNSTRSAPSSTRREWPPRGCS